MPGGGYVFLTYEAESLLRQGEIDHSATTANQALLLAQRIGASRCVLEAGFLPHWGVEGVQQFLDAVRSVA